MIRLLSTLALALGSSPAFASIVDDKSEEADEVAPPTGAETPDQADSADKKKKSAPNTRAEGEHQRQPPSQARSAQPSRAPPGRAAYVSSPNMARHQQAQQVAAQRSASDRSEASSERSSPDRSQSSNQRSASERSESSSQRATPDRSESSHQRAEGSREAPNRTQSSQSSRTEGTRSAPQRSEASHQRPSGSSAGARPAGAPSHKARPAGSGTRPSNGKHARPSSAKARPHHTHQVQHHERLPPRWVPSYHRYHIQNTPHWHMSYWGAGVFIYNPPPPSHTVVFVEGEGKAAKTVKHKTKPTRAVDRNGDFGVGLRAGSYMSGYEGGGGFGDMGLGLTARYRPVEAIGLELAWQQHSQNWEENSTRVNSPLQTSVQVYAFPWTRVSPYVSAGLTWNRRSINDDVWNGSAYETFTTQDTLFGPHAGLGVELALGDSAALDFEGRYIGFLDQDEADLSVPNAVQGTMGLNFYF